MYLQQHYIGEKYPVFFSSLFVQCTQQHDDGSHRSTYRYRRCRCRAIGCKLISLCVFFRFCDTKCDRNREQIDQSKSMLMWTRRKMCVLASVSVVLFAFLLLTVCCIIYMWHCKALDCHFGHGALDRSKTMSRKTKRKKEKKRTTMRRVEKELQLVSCVHLEMAEEGW